MFDLNIITCSATSSRLSRLLISLQPLLNHPLLNNIFLFCKYDKEFLNLKPVFSLWPSHVQIIYPILSRNIRAVHPGKFSILQLIDMQPDIFFPARHLTAAELSLLCKHRCSLANVTNPTLILEDDAILELYMIDYLLTLISYSSQHDTFIDLGSMNGLSAIGRRIQIGNNYNAYFSHIGLTRTTGAFIVTPLVAAKLLKNYEPISLPADLHHQYLLCVQGIPGIWPDRLIFKNISGSSDCPSAIQNQNV